MSRAVAGVILCGGASSRMGRPKALVELGDGTTALQRLAGSMRQAGLLPVVAVSGPLGPAAAALTGVDQVLTDHGTKDASGPLWGVDAALRQLQQDVVVWPVDMPWVPPGVLRLLAAQALPTVMAGNPLGALVPLALLPRVQALLAQRRTGVRALWREVGPQRLRHGRLLAVDPLGWAHAAFNTPDELAQLAARGAKWVM